MSTLRNKCLVACFCLVICLPTLDQVLGLSAFQTMENKGSAWPTTNAGSGIRALKKAARHFDTYYKTNFGGRNVLIYLHSLLYYYGLSESPVPAQVVIGKAGWLYVGDYHNRVVQQHRGLFPLHPDSARAIAQHLLAVQRKLAGRGAKLYVMIAPDSHSIYPEHLPDHLLPGQLPETPLDVLSRAMHHHPALPFMNLRDTLCRAKQHQRVYWPTDSHWNSYGALAGSTVVLNRIRHDFPAIRPIQAADYRTGLASDKPSDLLALMMLQGQNSQLHQAIGMKPALWSAATHQLVREEPTRQQAAVYLGIDVRQPSLLLFGDSFSEAMMDQLPAYFGRSTTLHQSIIDWPRVDREKPDVVIVEIVERNLYNLSRL